MLTFYRDEPVCTSSRMAFLSTCPSSAHQIALDLSADGPDNWSELARDGIAHECDGEDPYLVNLLGASSGPILAATDYVRAVPETIRAYLPKGRGYRTLGTDGFGRSDTRSVLRSFFQVDAQSILSRALVELGVSESA